MLFRGFVAVAVEVRSFSNIRYPRERYGHKIRGTWRAALLGSTKNPKEVHVLADPRAKQSE